MITKIDVRYVEAGKVIYCVDKRVEYWLLVLYAELCNRTNNLTVSVFIRRNGTEYSTFIGQTDISPTIVFNKRFFFLSKKGRPIMPVVPTRIKLMNIDDIPDQDPALQYV